MIRVLITDDHAVLRHGVRQILIAEGDIHVVAEAGNAQELAEALRKQPCDVLLLDLSLPGRGGLDILAELHKERPQLRILVFSMQPEEQFGARVLRLGASGFLSKSCPPEELVRAVRKAAAGGRYVSPYLAEQLAAELASESDRPLHEHLSAREMEVLRMIASGMTVTDIADALSLSVKTVSTYRSRLLEKMRMQSNAQLTAYAIRNGVVE